MGNIIEVDQELYDEILNSKFTSCKSLFNIQKGLGMHLVYSRRV